MPSECPPTTPANNRPLGVPRSDASTRLCWRGLLSEGQLLVGRPYLRTTRSPAHGFYLSSALWCTIKAAEKPRSESRTALARGGARIAWAPTRQTPPMKTTDGHAQFLIVIPSVLYATMYNIYMHDPPRCLARSAPTYVSLCACMTCHSRSANCMPPQDRLQP